MNNSSPSSPPEDANAPNDVNRRALLFARREMAARARMLGQEEVANEWTIGLYDHLPDIQGRIAAYLAGHASSLISRADETLEQFLRQVRTEGFRAAINAAEARVHYLTARDTLSGHIRALKDEGEDHAIAAALAALSSTPTPIDGEDTDNARL